MNQDATPSRRHESDTIPSEWLKIRLLPSDLISLEQILPRYQTWLAIEKVLEASESEQGLRYDEDGIPIFYFDPKTGRTRFPVPPSERDPVDDLLADLNDLTGLIGECPLSSWQPGDELWRFSSDTDSWRSAGRAGFVWLRNGQTHRIRYTVIS